MQAALPLLFLVFFSFAAPYCAAITRGLSAAFLDARYLKEAFRPLCFTVFQASMSAALSCAIGLPAAYLLSSGKRGAKLLRAISGVSFAMPAILVVLGFALFWGNAGAVNKLLGHLGFHGQGNSPPLRVLYRTEAIILAHAFYNFPLITRMAGDAFGRLRLAYAAPAASLGASPFCAFFTVILPLALPAILAACLLVFLYCFTSFAVVLALGGGPHVTTLSVEVYRASRVSLNYGEAGALALLETLTALLVFFLYIAVSRKAQGASGKNEAVFRSVISYPTRASRFLTICFLAALSVFTLGPVLSIPARSVLAASTRAGTAGFSLRWWEESVSGALPAFGRSLALAVFAATLSCAASLLAAQSARRLPGMRAFLRGAASSPLASSGVVLGLGFLLLYGREHGFLSLVLCHAIASVPFTYNSIYEGLASVPETALSAAYTLGASPFHAFLTVELPLAARNLRSAWSFAAAISLGEVSSVLMLGVQNWETLPLYIYRAAGAYRYGTACAAGTLLLLALFAAFAFAGGNPTPFARESSLR